MPANLTNMSVRDKKQALIRQMLENHDPRVPPDNVTAEVSMMFDRIQETDMQEGTASIVVWFRLIWTDPGFAWNTTEWGINKVTLRTSQIWTPDVVFYNSPNAEDALATMDAHVSPDGSFFWSRPGHLKILCNFEGLENFPLDELTCVIKVAAWFLDRDLQPIKTWHKDGGYQINGENAFQHYHLLDVSVTQRDENFTCCPDEFYPTLYYRLKFQRAWSFYKEKLIAPQVAAASVSWLTFWMHPEVGERIGFGITLLLTSVAFDWVAAGFMPVCDEKMMLMILTRWVSIFIIFSLVESTVVLYIYHWKAWVLEDFTPWPVWVVMQQVNKLRHKRSTGKGDMGGKMKLLGPLPEASLTPQAQPGEAPPAAKRMVVVDAGVNEREARTPRIVSVDDEQSASATQSATHEAQLNAQSTTSTPSTTSTTYDNAARIRLFRRAFFVLDEDYSNSLSEVEVHQFGSFMLGSRWTEDLLLKFMGGKRTLNLSEFCVGCTETLNSVLHDETKLEAMVEAFSQNLSRATECQHNISEIFAMNIDKVCRWLVPPIEIALMLVVLFSEYAE